MTTWRCVARVAATPGGVTAGSSPIRTEHPVSGAHSSGGRELASYYDPTPPRLMSSATHCGDKPGEHGPTSGTDAMPRCIKPGVTCIEGRPVVVILVIGALVIGAAILTLTVWYPEWWSVPTAASKPPVRRVRRDFPGGECRFRQAQLASAGGQPSVGLRRAIPRSRVSAPGAGASEV